MSLPFPPSPPTYCHSPWPSLQSGLGIKTEDRLLSQTSQLAMMRTVTLNKTRCAALSFLTPNQRHRTHLRSLGFSHPTRIDLRDSRSEHGNCWCSYHHCICATFLQNQPSRSSSVRAACIRSSFIPSLTISHSSFDEVHFGKFAAYYILREYYFDVHPPFAKLLFGLAGWFVGFDGQFNFENIGDNYTENHVPYIGMRALPAILGSLTIPVVYGIMKESGYGTVIAAFSASIVLFGTYRYISAATKPSL